ncbi:MAG: methyltransferase [Pseudomonadota bacterium]
MRAQERLQLALDTGLLALSERDRIAVFGPRAGTDLSVLPQDRCDLILTFRPDVDHFESTGWSCRLTPAGRYGAGIVFAARAKALSLARIAAAAEVCDAPLVVDGAKTDGIEALLKACRARGAVSEPLSKAHGKLFTFDPGSGVADWVARPPAALVEHRFLTAPGVFSSDGIDPASALLADTLPVRIGATVADLGAGWGYLSARVLERDTPIELHVVEADHVALDCARRNVDDSRAQFHWADATHWRAPGPLDAVVMNPPFHAGRTGDPDLGRAFIAAAARALGPRGTLYMVANRHLPYEAELIRCFGHVVSVGGDRRFKVYHASRPARPAR